MGARYPEDPNSIIRAITDVNAKAAALRAEGWTVELGVAENGTRIYVTISTTRACDPPKPEEAA